MKYWEIIADNLSKAGWSLGCVSAIDSNGITDVHRYDGRRFIVTADEKLRAFVELELAIHVSEEIAEPITDYQAIPYIKIRLRLTRQIRTGFHKRIS